MKSASKIAKALGLTDTGLQVLAKACADPNGTARGTFGRNPGSAKLKLFEQGYVTPNQHGGFYESTITDAGREIVRRAREMGW